MTRRKDTPRSCAQQPQTIEPVHALWLVSTSSNLHERSLDLAAVAKECVPPISTDAFARICERAGMEARFGEAPDLAQLRHPVAVRATTSIASTDQNEAPSSGSANNNAARETWLVLLQRSQDIIDFVEFGHEVPQRMSAAELRPRLTGSYVLIKPTVSAARDPDDVDDSTGRFGFRWFVPELLKHKSIWREVVLASLVLQLIALAFPLFTQAIIDKVVVHRTESTLIALTAGMAVFIVFTTALTWIRQYLILHTGNRVDAVLGSHVFEHLFKLPPRYFQHRPTGIIAARMQGIESIREFISSAAITLLSLPSDLCRCHVLLQRQTHSHRSSDLSCHRHDQRTCSALISETA